MATHKLNDPWLIAVWPGMGHVALSAGYYLMAKMGMHVLAEFSPSDLFDADHVVVKDGILRSGPMPRSRLFVWIDPRQRRDLLVFIGEAQPPLGRRAFCHRLIEYAKELGVSKVFTFAAMATEMHPEHAPRVFAAATDETTRDELHDREVELLRDGNISGLNGVLVGVAAEMGLSGACLLGEMPHIFAQLPFPSASLAVLRHFAEMAGIDLDLSELSKQADEVRKKLGELLSAVERNLLEAQQAQATHEPEDFSAGAEEEPRISPTDERHLERLFEAARSDRSAAYELKTELDRLGVFDLYEDRFLDLFKKPSD